MLAISAGGAIAVIECKLATNPEVKRKVIGQVMEYGANLWEMSYEELAEAINRRPSTSLAELAKHGTVEEFLAIYDWVIDKVQVI